MDQKHVDEQVELLVHMRCTVYEAKTDGVQAVYETTAAGALALMVSYCEMGGHDVEKVKGSRQNCWKVIATDRAALQAKKAREM